MDIRKRRWTGEKPRFVATCENVENHNKIKVERKQDSLKFDCYGSQSVTNYFSVLWLQEVGSKVQLEKCTSLHPSFSYHFLKKSWAAGSFDQVPNAVFTKMTTDRMHGDHRMATQSSSKFGLLFAYRIHSPSPPIAINTCLLT